MLFNKKTVPPIEPLKREKLSQQSLDNFAQKYAADNGSILYTLQSGDKIHVSGSSIISSKGGLEHFLYLLGQTAPYHMTAQPTYPLKYMAYIVDENKKLIPWCTNSTALSQFVTIGHSLGYIPLKKDDNQNTVVERFPTVKPIIHRERTHTDD